MVTFIYCVCFTTFIQQNQLFLVQYFYQFKLHTLVLEVKIIFNFYTLPGARLLQPTN